MKKSHRVIVNIIASVGLGLAIASALANPEDRPGMKGGMGHGMMANMGPGAMGGPNGPMAAQQLMTPEERAALMEKMHNAKTPEERQKIASAMHAEMQKRANEKGISLPEHRGPGAGFGPDSGKHAH